MLRADSPGDSPWLGTPSYETNTSILASLETRIASPSGIVSSFLQGAALGSWRKSNGRVARGTLVWRTAARPWPETETTEDP